MSPLISSTQVGKLSPTVPTQYLLQKAPRPCHQEINGDMFDQRPERS